MFLQDDKWHVWCIVVKIGSPHVTSQISLSNLRQPFLDVGRGDYFSACFTYAVFKRLLQSLRIDPTLSKKKYIAEPSGTHQLTIMAALLLGMNGSSARTSRSTSPWWTSSKVHQRNVLLPIGPVVPVLSGSSMHQGPGRVRRCLESARLQRAWRGGVIRPT